MFLPPYQNVSKCVMFFFIAGIQSGQLFEKGTFPFPFGNTLNEIQEKKTLICGYGLKLLNPPKWIYQWHPYFETARRSLQTSRRGKPAKESTWMARAKRQGP